jgi:hypothetical protein
MGPDLNGPEGGSNGLWGIDYWGIISPDGLELFYASYRASCIGLADIFVSTRATPSDPWGPPVNLGPVVNTYGRDYPTGISSDGLTLFIAADNRPGGLGGLDMYMTRRPYKGADWGEPVSLGPSLNTARGELCMISPDGRRVYGYDAEFNTSPVSGADLWMAPIIPLVDFNGDGIVDANDQALLTAHLGQSDLRYDIGPFPWGDGKVDANDLEVLQQYLGRDDPTVIACWRLDEVEGVVAADSAGTNDGIVMGSPLWQPAGGKVGGALQFPGNASFVLTPFVCDPAAGPFSVFAWVQGGAPGQVILAQINGDCWLKAGDLQQMLKTADLQGALMTELKEARGAPLFSATVITDGAWHRVGLVWDGSNRILCVDGVEVVRDKMPTVAGSTDGLTLGGPTNPAQGGFWTGLIDDVRIYNRAVKP